MKKLIFILTAIAAFFAGCSSDEGIIPEESVVIETPKFTEEEMKVGEQLNDFGLGFLQGAIAQSGSDENIIVSPFSASMFLSMLANVEDEDVASSICATIGCKNIANVNSFSAKCLSWLPNVNQLVKLNYANSVWYDKSFSLNPSFANTVTDNYLTDIFPRDFKSGNIVKDINDWVSKRTGGKITEAVTRKPDNLTILNALYFSGRWLEPFLRSRTVSEAFYGTRGTSTVDMMKNDLFALYGETEDAQILRLYFIGYFYIDLIMPAENLSVDSFVADKLETYWMNLTHYFRPYYVHLSFPKFEIKPKKAQINDVLRDLGLDNINISSILGNNNVYGDICVEQVSTIRFDEDGAEAATVTDNGYSAPTSKETTMTINRPFLFLIHEPLAKQCIFAGKVTNL